MPLITRRSSARSTPRTSVGKSGSIRAHCSSLSQNRFLLMNPSPNTNQYRIVEPERLMSSDPRKLTAHSFRPKMKKKLSACPGWLRLSEDRTSFIFMPDRADIVRTIFELSIAGLGGYTIAKQLNAKKVPPFGPSPKWDQSTIHNLLRNRATIGEHQPKQYRNRKEFPVGDPVPNYYPAVIEEGLFSAAQVARQRNLVSGRGRKGRFITNLFAGIPTCAYCGSA